MKMQTEIVRKIRSKEDVPDEDFDDMFPPEFRTHSNQHFTSIFIAKTAAQYLCFTEHEQILDVGSGIGKFCIVGALQNNARFTGVEMRKNFVEAGNTFIRDHGISNVHFINDNILNVSFKGFKGVYLFNPFFELLDNKSCIDDQLASNKNAYDSYFNHVFTELENMNAGTRLVAYYTPEEQIPTNFHKVQSLFGDTLRFYEKK